MFEKRSPPDVHAKFIIGTVFCVVSEEIDNSLENFVFEKLLKIKVMFFLFITEETETLILTILCTYIVAIEM